jgi:N-acetyl-anhydromuramoyl-L-alanine amidase
MHICPDTWLEPARHCPSPNYDARPPGSTIDLVVIHCISLPACVFGGDNIDALFTNRLDPLSFPNLVGVRVSAHLLIRRDGEIVQYVPFAQRAWHAGVSEFAGRTRCNDFSIGIELEGCVEMSYTEQQYTCLNAVLAVLRQHWPELVLAGHSDIAPQRKQDPGPRFDWARVEK